jgi:branched-chain amino acid transport system ATP-binding protein
MNYTDVILEGKNLKKSFLSYKSIDGVNIKIHRGDIHGLIGPNGAGKTTCFNV